MDIRMLLMRGLRDLDLSTNSDLMLGEIYITGMTRSFILLKEEAEDLAEDLKELLNGRT